MKKLLMVFGEGLFFRRIVHNRAMVKVKHINFLLLAAVVALCLAACAGTDPDPIPAQTASKIDLEPTSTVIPEPTNTPTEVMPTSTGAALSAIPTSAPPTAMATPAPIPQPTATAISTTAQRPNR